MHLFELTKSYDLVYNWFNILKKDEIEIIAYVIMPNHVHCILYFPEAGFNLDKILSNGKRFMAYKVLDRLEFANEIKVLKTLQDALTERERKKKQLHKVFKDSFDAKAIFSEKFLVQKLNYIHPSYGARMRRGLQLSFLCLIKELQLCNTINLKFSKAPGSLFLSPICFSFHLFLHNISGIF